MKRLTTLFMVLFAFSTFAQVSVEEKKVNIDGNKDGFFVSIPYGTKDRIEKELKKELKSWKGKYVNKGYIFADDCKLKEIGKNTFDVYARIDDNPDGGAYVSIAVDLGGAYLSSKQNKASTEYITKRLHNFGVAAAKSVVDDEIKVEEKALKERTKELETLEEEQSKLEKEIEEYKKRIEANEASIETSKTNQETKKTEIKEQEEKVKEVQAKKAAIK